MRPFSFVFFIVVMVWLGSIFISTEAQVRIERTCAPVGLVGRMIESIAALTSPNMPPVVKRNVESWVQGCQFVVWRQWYQQDFDDREKAIQKLEAERDALLSEMAGKGKRGRE